MPVPAQQTDSTKVMRSVVMALLSDGHIDHLEPMLTERFYTVSAG